MGCGPTDQEVGAAVIITLPAIVLVTILIGWSLEAIRRCQPAESTGRQLFRLVAALIGLGLATAFWVPSALRLFVLAFVIVGGGQLTVALLIWRLMIKPGRSALLPAVGCSLFVALPAVPLLFDVIDQQTPINFWLGCSGMGWGGGALLLILLVEAVVVRRRDSF